MPENLTMSTKARPQLQVIGHRKHGKMTVFKAVITLSLTERQRYRILHRYRHQGDAELIHRLRGSLITLSRECRRRPPESPGRACPSHGHH
jgi:hypothetical protein